VHGRSSVLGHYGTACRRFPLLEAVVVAVGSGVPYVSASVANGGGSRTKVDWRASRAWVLEFPREFERGSAHRGALKTPDILVASCFQALVRRPEKVFGA
jgi:hypothetical protein